MEYFFSDCLTVDEIKKRYRLLAFEHHPDRGGDLATMQRVNRDYHAALKRCNLQSAHTEDGKAYTYRYDETVEESVITVISSLLSLKMEGVKIMLIGTWVWVVGETKPFKDSLKAIGCKWHATRSCWYFTAKPYRGFYSKNGLESLAAKYGYSDVSDMKKREKRISH